MSLQPIDFSDQTRLSDAAHLSFVILVTTVLQYRVCGIMSYGLHIHMVRSNSEYFGI